MYNYWDQQLCDLLEFGFPLDFDRNCLLHSVEQNHTSANDNRSHISQFLSEELQYNAILGAFKDIIEMHIPPLLVRAKQNSNAKRTIMDLSWPKGASVNNGVALALQPRYRAFRHIKVDPGDIDILGIKFQNK